MSMFESGIKALEISAEMMGRVEVIYPTVIWDSNTVILVDTGYPGQLPLIREAMERENVPFHLLDKIVVTHQDLDHIGSLSSIAKELNHRPQVLASAIEKPYIEGELRLLKLTPEAVASAVKALPPELPEPWRQAFISILENPPKGTVNRIIQSGDVLPYCGGITVIDTPGHTPGHISLYHQVSKTLIAADALTVVDGKLTGPDPRYTLDLAQATESLKQLCQYDIDSVICYHGGPFTWNVNERIRELTNCSK